MKTVRIEVDEKFREMLDNTIAYLRQLTGKEISRVDLTKILACDGSNGLINLKLPVILIEGKRVRGKQNKSIWNRQFKIVLE